MIKISLFVFLLIASNTVFAANWIKYGANQDSDLYYDDAEIVFVKYKNEKGRDATGIRLRTLENFNGPKFKRDGYTFKQAIKSSVFIQAFDCSDSMVYSERTVYSSALNDRGTLVYEWTASPDSIELLYFRIQINKEMPSFHTYNPADSRESFKGWQIEKIINKLCALAK